MKGCAGHQELLLGHRAMPAPHFAKLRSTTGAAKLRAAQGWQLRDLGEALCDFHSIYPCRHPSHGWGCWLQRDSRLGEGVQPHFCLLAAPGQSLAQCSVCSALCRALAVFTHSCLVQKLAAFQQDSPNSAQDVPSLLPGDSPLPWGCRLSPTLGSSSLHG